MARVTVVNDNAEFLALVKDILEDDRYERPPSMAIVPTHWIRFGPRDPTSS